MSDILNIIVFYDNYEEIKKYIEEVNKLNSQNVDIAIVVNKDTEHVAQLLIEVFPKIMFFDFKENVGYLNALIKVVNEIKGKTYKIYILSNTDIKYISENFFEYLLKKKYPANIGCVAPSVFSTKNNNFSNPHYVKRIKEKKMRRLVKIFSHPWLAQYYMKLADYKANKTKKEEKKSQDVYSPHGCFMIFVNDFICDLCKNEYGAKMYSEESYIGEMLIKNGKRCFYDSNIKIVHTEGAVTGKIDYVKKVKYMKESMEYILKNFYGDDE